MNVSFIVIAIIIILILLLVLKGLQTVRTSRRRAYEKLLSDYGQPVERTYREEEISRHICKYYEKHPEPGQIDEITFHDLHLEQLYQKMNFSLSAAGDEYFYYRLRTPFRKEEPLSAFEDDAQYFMAHAEERGRLQMVFLKLGRMSKYSLYEYLDLLSTLGERKNIRYYVGILCLIVSIALMFVSVPVGLILLLIVICWNMITYYRKQREIGPYIASFRYIFRLLEAGRALEKLNLAQISDRQARMHDDCEKLNRFRHNAFLVMSSSGSTGMSSSNPLDVVLDYLRMIFFLDLIKFNQMLREVRAQTDTIDDMVTIIGELEAAVGIGAYRASLTEGWCQPVFLPQGESKHISVRGLYHPLLEQPVKNDMDTSRGVLLTGSNASGKSTFLRAAAVCALLAQSFHTCPAEQYEAGLFDIFTSMSLEDDLIAGDSYYMAEVKSIRRILEAAKDARARGGCVLCFVDEVLRGTNTAERIAASTQILKALSGEGVLCFAATHDLELTRYLAEIYDNFHFEEQMQGDDIHFPYLIQKGPAVSRNAIALLRVLGYDEDLVSAAEKMAQSLLADEK